MHAIAPRQKRKLVMVYCDFKSGVSVELHSQHVMIAVGIGGAMKIVKAFRFQVEQQLCAWFVIPPFVVGPLDDGVTPTVCMRIGFVIS